MKVIAPVIDNLRGYWIHVPEVCDFIRGCLDGTFKEYEFLFWMLD